MEIVRLFTAVCFRMDPRQIEGEDDEEDEDDDEEDEDEDDED